MHDALLQVSCKIWAVLGKRSGTRNSFLFVWPVFYQLQSADLRAGLAASGKQIIPRQVQSEFDRDVAVGSLVHYDLFLRKKNTFGYINTLNLIE